MLTGGALVAFLTVGHTLIDTFSSMLTGLLPTLQVRFGLTETALALLLATLAFSTSVTQPLLGTLADRFGVRAVSALGIALEVGLLSLIGVAPSVYLLFALLLIGGLGSAAYHPSGLGIARAAGGRNKGLAVSLFGAGGSLGVALGPVLILYVISTFGLGFTPWLMVPGILLGALTYFVVPREERSRGRTRVRIFDGRLLAGPVGLLSLVEILSSLAFVTFTGAMPLWLVAAHGVARDSTLIGWTLAAFSLSAALGGIGAGALSVRVSPRLLVPGAMLLAIPPLYAALQLGPGSAAFFVAVALSGALINAGLPLLIVAAQDLAPRAVATASGMLMGFATGVAALLYVGVGRLQELLGLAPAMRLTYLVLIPGAALAYYALTRHGVPTDRAGSAAELAGAACMCALCGCANAPAPARADARRPAYAERGATS
jgi:FSR family fosmidomycin resistance protein-like MFS transporter